MINGKYEVDDINRFYNDKMLYFIIGNYISAEYLIEEEDYITANKRLSSALECLPYSCLPEEEKNNNIERLGKCLDLIRNEYKDKYKRELI